MNKDKAVLLSDTLETEYRLTDPTYGTVIFYNRQDLYREIASRKQKRLFAEALKKVMDKQDIPSVAAVARMLDCSSYAVHKWLDGHMLPSRKLGPRVLKVFGLDSRNYGGNWNKGRQ